MSIAKFFSRRVLVRASLLAVAAGWLPSLDAQVVRGTVVDEASGRGLPATVVVLLDSTGKRLAGVLAGDDGTYAIRIATPGRYSLRAERIGFRADAPVPVRIAVGQTVELRLVTRPVPVMLSAVRVTGRTACIARASDGRDVSAVWDEARKALYATDLTQQQELFAARISRFERTLDPQSGRVVTHTAKESSGITRSPFVSVPAAQLSADGFVRQVGSETVYFGPDAAVLLSDEFLGDHCFRLREGSGRRSAMIGLAFEPVRGRDKPDIDGTLWLDKATAELRDLEYRYRGLPGLPSDVRSEEFGGRVEFHRMPSGAWIVERWVIRMPVVVDKGSLARRDAITPGTAGAPTERIQLAAIREEGGEVTETVARGGQRQLAREAAGVRGTVYDSTRMAPLGDARVFLDGTQFSARSGADGAFVLEQIPPGTYALSVTHPRFDSLGTRAPAATVTIRTGEETSAHLAVPSFTTMVTRDCAEAERTTTGVMLRGNVRDGATGGPAKEAHVMVTWNRLESASTNVSAVSQQRASTRTDAAGRYVLCALPEGVRLTAVVTHDGRRSAPASLVPQNELSMLDMSVGSETVVAVADPTPPAAMSAVDARPSGGNRAMEDFARRRRRGNGSYLTRAQIEKSNATRLSDLLRRMPSVNVMPSENGTLIVELRGTKRVTLVPGGAQPTTPAGGGSTRPPAGPPQPSAQITVRNCPAGFLLDGMPMDSGGSLDMEMRPGTLEAIEVYTPAQVPIELSGRYSECGVVMIWTRAFADRPGSD